MKILRSYPSLLTDQSMSLTTCSLVLYIALSTTFSGCSGETSHPPTSSPVPANSTNFIVTVKDKKFSESGFSSKEACFTAELDVDGKGEAEKIDLGKDAVCITAWGDDNATTFIIEMSQENITKLSQELNKDAVKKDEPSRIKVQLKLMTSDGSKTATLWSAKLFAVLEGYGGKKTLPATPKGATPPWQGQKAAATTFALYTKVPANDGEKLMLYNELQQLTAK